MATLTIVAEQKWTIIIGGGVPLDVVSFHVDVHAHNAQRFT